jgi:hypothetical protein
VIPGDVGGQHAHHGVNVCGAEALLQRVKSEPGELGLDEIRPVGHDRFQALVSRAALPPRNEVQQVLAVRRFARLFAVLAREFD